MFKKLVIASALSLIASASFAQTAPSVYAGVDMGRTTLKDVDGHENSYGAFVGYNFNENFALEGGYRRLYHGDDGSANQIHLSGVATMPLSGGFNLFGRLGYNRLTAKDSDGSEHISKVLYGAGFGYAFTPTIMGRFEVQKPHSDLTNVGVSVAFKF